MFTYVVGYKIIVSEYFEANLEFSSGDLIITDIEDRVTRNILDILKTIPSI